MPRVTAAAAGLFSLPKNHRPSIFVQRAPKEPEKKAQVRSKEFFARMMETKRRNESDPTFWYRSRRRRLCRLCRRRPLPPPPLSPPLRRLPASETSALPLAARSLPRFAVRRT